MDWYNGYMENSKQHHANMPAKVDKSEPTWDQLSDHQKNVILALFQTNGVPSAAQKYYSKMTGNKRSAFYKHYRTVKDIWQSYKSALLDKVSTRLLCLCEKAIDVYEEGLNHEDFRWRFQSATQILDMVLPKPSDLLSYEAQQKSKSPQDVRVRVVTVNNTDADVQTTDETIVL